jgi:hypothetical protein
VLRSFHHCTLPPVDAGIPGSAADSDHIPVIGYLSIFVVLD